MATLLSDFDFLWDQFMPSKAKESLAETYTDLSPFGSVCNQRASLGKSGWSVVNDRPPAPSMHLISSFLKKECQQCIPPPYHQKKIDSLSSYIDRTMT